MPKNRELEFKISQDLRLPIMARLRYDSKIDKVDVKAIGVEAKGP